MEISFSFFFYVMNATPPLGKTPIRSFRPQVPPLGNFLSSTPTHQRKTSWEESKQQPLDEMRAAA
jgi:hypothetical protein